MRYILMILLMPAIAIAELIPPGCYVADYYRTDECYQPGLWDYRWYSPNYNTTEDLVREYGEVMTYVLQTDQSWRDYANQQATLVKANKKLITKLRKICGAKCKRVR